jgi:hypothetical protein
LRIALVVVGLIFTIGILPADDSGRLRDAGGIFVVRVAQSAGKLEPDLAESWLYSRS